jgi:hypothetical protein
LDCSSSSRYVAGGERAEGHAEAADAEAVKTATHLDGLIPVKINGVLKIKYERHFGINPPFARALMTWGEAGTVIIKSRTFHPNDKAGGFPACCKQVTPPALSFLDRTCIDGDGASIAPCPQGPCERRVDAKVMLILDFQHSVDLYRDQTVKMCGGLDRISSFRMSFGTFTSCNIARARPDNVLNPTSTGGF